MVNKELIKEKAQDRDFEKEFGTAENSEEDSAELDLKKKAAKARRKGSRAISTARERAPSRERVRNQVVRQSSSSKVGSSFLKMAEGLDAARGAFERNFGQFNGLGIEGDQEMFGGSDIEAGNDLNGDFFGSSDSDDKQKKSGFDMDLGFDMEV